MAQHFNQFQPPPQEPGYSVPHAQQIAAAYAGAKKALEEASIPARFLTSKQTSQFLGLATITLATWRGEDKGPPYTKLGRHIRYNKEDLIRFMSTTKADGEGPIKIFPGNHEKPSDYDLAV
ncbi:helix-turn-helix domain-containing protein [Candidatus Nitronereus thalassa]|uniref:Helix-turn-helix domain-containing protein n=1 Tax=Candidatus Nitronereus thalassa TaxID=3020898 RepID=A0ABU3KCR3_9BACT|nr:helix-turn-helix domain-containing protein [Candidatus Nitronereus thalassa]MDT7044305.1 helix-turn-helix domain-containing protein [Candidatus Nitronereus thalassa]